MAPVTRAARFEAIASELLSELPARFALFGLNFGATVAMDILRQAPERVDRLCLMGGSPLPESPAQAAAREDAIIAAQSGRLQDSVDMLRPLHALVDGPNRALTRALLGEMARDLGAEVFVRQARAMQRARDQQAVLRRAKVSTLIACGADDPVTPLKRHQFVAELMPNARLHVIENAGHMAPLEQPAQVTAMIDAWLRAPMVLR
ncbi:MAG: alpha/beta hydrolase [Pseudomonadota bacterium]|nr:alpha/beta hydrolase [Pseudomonadota bacterium]